MAAQKGIANWQPVVWREWRNCTDKTYADHLFDLVGSGYVGLGGVAVLVLIGALYGSMVGYLVGIVLQGWSPIQGWTATETLPFSLAWAAGTTGALTAGLLSHRLSWRLWLELLTPRLLTDQTSQWGAFNLELVLGVIGGQFLGPGVSGAIIGYFVGGARSSFKRNDYRIFFSIATGAIGSVIGFVMVNHPPAAILAGLCLGLWLEYTWDIGLVGVPAVWLGVVEGLLFFGRGDWLFGWLATGIALGLGLIFRQATNLQPEPDRFYETRPWYFWWTGQPATADAERALQQALLARPEMKAVWAEALDRWARQKQQPGEPGDLIAALRLKHWVKRFAAWHGLIALGGRAVEPLKEIAVEPDHPLFSTANWLLVQIGRETTRRFGSQTDTFLCPHCLTYFRQHVVPLWFSSLTYYGCRICGQSRDFLRCAPEEVVVVLDATVDNRGPKKNGRVSVNWLEKRALFDFGRVEIGRVTDEEVERFAVQVGNDTDPFRISRYKQIRCRVDPDSHLSENSLRILEHTFGQVVVEAG